MTAAIQSFDAFALLFIQAHLRTPFLNTVMVFSSELGNSGFIWILLGFILLIPKQTRRGAFLSLLCLLAAAVVNDLVLKLLAARPRPYATVRDLTILVAPLNSYSFPSGHASAGFAMALCLTLAFGKKGACAYLPAALIAFSRCYVGVHYPSDVLAGALVGTLTAYFFYRLLDRRLKMDFLSGKKAE